MKRPVTIDVAVVAGVNPNFYVHACARREVLVTTATTACGDDWRRENAASVRIPRQGGAPPWCQRSDETEYTLPGVEAVGRSGESRAALVTRSGRSSTRCAGMRRVVTQRIS